MSKRLRQIIAKIDIPIIVQHIKSFVLNQTSGCHGNAFVEVTSAFIKCCQNQSLGFHGNLLIDNSDRI